MKTRIVYHGSREPYIDEIQGGMPGYKGSIGAGAYVTFDPQVARFYGPYVYAFELLIDDDDIFWLTPETMSVVSGFEGHSVLVGERVPPFSFNIKGERFTVGSEEMVDYIASSEAQRALANLVGADAAAALTESGTRLPDENDVSEWVEDLDEEDVKAKLRGAQVNTSDMTVDQQYDALIELASDPVLDAVHEVRHQVEKRMGTILELEDIGNEAEHLGYKGVSLEGARGRFPDEELLVFDSSNLKKIGAVEVDPLRRNPKIVGGVEAYAAAGIAPNGDVVSMPVPPPRVQIGSRSYALSDTLTPVLSFSPEFEQGGAKVMSGGGDPWRYVWVYEPESGRLDMYRYSDGEWKVLGTVSDNPQTFEHLRRARQLNTVTPEELAEFEEHMRARNEDTIASLQAIWEDAKTPEQRRVEELVLRYWNERTQPMLDGLWESIKKGAYPIGFEYDPGFAERTGRGREDQAKSYAMSYAIRRSGFEPFDSPLEEYVVRGLGLSDSGELSDMQAIQWAHGDVLDVIYRRML